MRIYGLTGGIASGKSTVANHLRSLGANIVDADVLAREVVAPGTEGLEEVVRTFGPHLLTPEGQLDRKALGAVVFADKAALAKLNGLLHPRVARAAQEAMQAFRESGAPFAFYEVPLLVENNLHKGMDGLVVVSLPVEEQLARLQARDGLSAEEAMARIQSQLPLADKLAVATHVIDNSGPPEETRRQVRSLWQELSGAQVAAP